MKRKQFRIMVATLALLIALPAGAAWGANIGIEVVYDWDGKCVSNIDFVDPDDKDLTTTKKARKISWHLEPRTAGNDADKGDWEIVATTQAELCDSTYKVKSKKKKQNVNQNVITCQVAKDIKYEYDLIWRDSNCNGNAPVKADPVIIFDDGSGGGSFTLLAFAAGALFLTTAYLGFKLYARSAGP